MIGFLLKTERTTLTFLNLGSPTGLKFLVEHGASRAIFEMGVEHAPGAAPFSLGLRPREEQLLADLTAVGMAPRGTGVLGAWDGRTSLFVTHMHLDHSALVPCVHPDVPLYYPEAMEPLREACARAGYLPWRQPPGTPVADRQCVAAGDIEVEFVAVDHDLPGAAGLLVRTPELTLAYTGDHRWHGLDPQLTEGFAAAARGAQVLLHEVVSLGREPIVAIPGQPPAELELGETDVIERFGRLLDGASALVVVNLYPMNRSRVHAFGAACAARGRSLLLKRQAATIADWPLVLEDVDAARRHPERYCVQLEFGSLPTLIDLRPPPGSVYVHSNGVPLGPYDPTYPIMVAWARAMGMELVSLGSSGHSRPADVARMVEAVRPQVVLPVHSRRPEALRVPGVRVLLPEVHRPYAVDDLGVASTRS